MGTWALRVFFLYVSNIASDIAVSVFVGDRRRPLSGFQKLGAIRVKAVKASGF